MNCYIPKKEEEVCSICLCELSRDNLITTTCNHIFHKKCIITWIGQSDTCPLCRTEYPMPIKSRLNPRELLIPSISLMPSHVVEFIDQFIDIVIIDENSLYEIQFINNLILANISTFIRKNQLEMNSVSADMNIAISRKIRETLIRRTFN